MGEHDKFVGMTKGQFMVLIGSIFLAALLISVSVLSVGLTSTSSDVDELRALTERVNRDSARACDAINGSIEFWLVLRDYHEEALRDPDLPPMFREATVRFHENVTNAIDKRQTLIC